VNGDDELYLNLWKNYSLRLILLFINIDVLVIDTSVLAKSNMGRGSSETYMFVYKL
jgi:hypothetical protein